MKQKPFESYEQRLAQFKESERQQQAGEKQAGVAKVVTQALYPDNPYLRARLDVLGKYSPEHRAEILAYERDNKLDNRFYAEFVSDIAKLGDTYSL